MSEDQPGPFHEAFLQFLQSDLLQKTKEEGWDEHSDPEVRQYRDLLTRAIRSSEPIPFEEIVRRYHDLFGVRGPLHLDQKLIEAFPEKQMQSLGLPPLKMVRGLPRLYRKTQPAVSKIKRDFAYLPSLKRAAAEKAIFSLYADVPVPKDAKLVILSLSDFSMALESAKAIRKAFGFLDIHLFGFDLKRVPEMEGIQVYSKNDSWSEEDLLFLRGADLILVMPTVDAEIEELRETVESIPDLKNPPIWEFLGRYGLVESGWFYPVSGRRSLGLHFLEKGIFIRPREENTTGPEWLFGKSNEASYKQTHRFFLASLKSPAGIFVYLHALLKSLEKDTKQIDICFPEADGLIRYLEERLGKGLLEAHYGVKQIVIELGSERASIEYGEGRKVLRFLCPDSISQADRQRLSQLSEDFAACSDDDSFSEIVSANKVFFFDAPDRARAFLKDLVALAENRIPSHRATLAILRLFIELLTHNIAEERGEWVDEFAFHKQEPMPLLAIAESIGQWMQDPDAIFGFKKLNRILAEEYSCSAFLVQLLQRSVCHRRRPDIALLEEEEMSRFALNLQPFAAVIHRLKDALAH